MSTTPTTRDEFEAAFGTQHIDWECLCDPAYGTCPDGMCENPQPTLSTHPKPH